MPLTILAHALLLGLALWAGSACAFDFSAVAARARELAGRPYQAPPALPEELKGLNYDQYRDIRFRQDRFLWRDADLPFEIAFFHEGLYYDQPVRINEIATEGVREIPFDPTAFDYGANKQLDPAKLRELRLGFAGFRVHYALNKPDYKDEVLVFLGASYFRALGKGQQYGTSARALALDTAVPSGEEFPRFVEFWIQRPAPSATSLTVYGLLDSKRTTGAYRFVLRPGESTVVEVKAQLFLRAKVEKLGLAPLTSMYFFGENQPAPYQDYRPEVHDADGLSLHSADGEWIWRPLVNPRRLLVTSFSFAGLRGFGLMQRDRSFAHYEDTEVRHELRPSVWVQPHPDWGPGRVELVQIPAPDETNDNIVAYWVPDRPPALGEPYDLAYKLLWEKDRPTRPPESWVVQTRRGRGYMRKPDNSINFVVDWRGPALERLDAGAKVEAAVTAVANAKLLETNAWHNDVAGGWRMTVRLQRLDDSKPVELRAYLRSGEEAISETWSYVLPPP